MKFKMKQGVFQDLRLSNIRKYMTVITYQQLHTTLMGPMNITEHRYVTVKKKKIGNFQDSPAT